MKDTQLAQIALTKDATGAIANPIYLSTAFQLLILVNQQVMIIRAQRIQHAVHLRKRSLH